jgi:integrase
MNTGILKDERSVLPNGSRCWFKPNLHHPRKSFTIASLRHTLNSWLEAAGVPQERRQLITGHADARTNTRYTHVEIAALGAALKAGLAALARG